MKFKKESDKVFFSKDLIVNVGAEEINFLKNRIMQTKDKTVRLCMHSDVADSIHEMFIMHSKEAYIRPHKHPNKSVSYHIIEGMADMVVFDETGGIVDVIPMGEYRTGRNYYYRLNEAHYYTPLVRSDFLLFHEIMNGPFKPSDTVYAPWAAEGNDTVALGQFQKELLSRVDEFIAHSSKKPGLN